MNVLNTTGLTVGFLAYATIVGNPIRRLLLNPTLLEGRTPSLTIRWMSSLVSGLAAIPIVFLTAGLLPGAAGPATAWTLLTAAILLNLFIYRHQIGNPRRLLKSPLATLALDDRWFAAILLATFAFQMFALVGLWITPGDDAKLYSLITRRFMEQRGIPSDWGAYANPGWYVERTHLLLPGFSSTVASTVFLFATEVTATVSVLSSVFRVLTAATLYVLVYVLTRRKLPAALAMAIYGLLVVEPPVGWFQWGGMAELAAISLLPLAVAGTYILCSEKVRPTRYVLWLSIIIGGMSLLHAFAFFYFLAFLVPLSLLMLWERRALILARTWLPVFLGLLLVSGPILNALGPEASIATEYSATNPGWTPIFGWSISAAEGLMGLGWRVSVVYGPVVALLLLVSLVFLRELALLQKRVLVVLALWFAGLFFPHENNPNGLFLVPFPLWYRIDANRTFGVSSLVAASVVALTVEYIHERVVPHRPNRSRSYLARVVWSRSDGRARLAAIGVLAILAGSQILANGGMLVAARAESPVQPDDIQAFAWIQSETPQNATFFVNWADAGPLLPSYADRRVVMPFGVLTNYSLLRDYQEALEAFITDPASNQSIRFMRSTGVTHLYAGPARIYDRPGFNATRIATAGYFDMQYHVGSVWIFRFRETVPTSFSTLNPSRNDRSPDETIETSELVHFPGRTHWTAKELGEGDQSPGILPSISGPALATLASVPGEPGDPSDSQSGWTCSIIAFLVRGGSNCGSRSTRAVSPIPALAAGESGEPAPQRAAAGEGRFG